MYETISRLIAENCSLQGEIEVLREEKRRLNGEAFNHRNKIADLEDGLAKHKVALEALKALVDQGFEYQDKCEALELVLLKVLAEKHKGRL